MSLDHAGCLLPHVDLRRVYFHVGAFEWLHEQKGAVGMELLPAAEYEVLCYGCLSTWMT